MRVLLISANTEQTNILPLPLGLNCIAVATRNAGHDVRFLDLLTEKNIKKALNLTIKSFKPEIIGISIRNIDD
jgi:B12 binding domain